MRAFLACLVVLFTGSMALAQSATLLAQSKDNIAKRAPAKPASDA